MTGIELSFDDSGARQSLPTVLKVLRKVLSRYGDSPSGVGFVVNRYRDGEITDADLPQIYPLFDAECQNALDERLARARVERADRATRELAAAEEQERLEQWWLALPNYRRCTIPEHLASKSGWRRRGFIPEGTPVARSGTIALYPKPVCYWRHRPAGYHSHTYWRQQGRDVIGEPQHLQQHYGWPQHVYGLWDEQHTRPRTWRCRGLCDVERTMLKAIERKPSHHLRELEDWNVVLAYADWLEEQGREPEAHHHRQEHHLYTH